MLWNGVCWYKVGHFQGGQLRVLICPIKKKYFMNDGRMLKIRQIQLIYFVFENSTH